jgi:hypothetical protein
VWLLGRIIRWIAVKHGRITTRLAAMTAILFSRRVASKPLVIVPAGKLDI